jgi:dTDP-4-dehydrorhamnose reductase
MKILLTGTNGQIGHELERSLQCLGDLVALDRVALDLSRPNAIRETLRGVRPQLIVNAAAYTAVDRAEGETALAARINYDAPALMAEEARRLGAAMVHFSTDYVFDGTSSSPYREEDRTGPVNTYGRTKLAGEQAVAAAGIGFLILRTSWVYGMRGNNFLRTILRLGAERDELCIVADQHGAPTWCRSVADVTGQILAQLAATSRGEQWWAENSGVYHLSCRGQTTWYGFACEALRRIAVRMPRVKPIASSDYPTAAKRPHNSVLSCARMERSFRLRMPDWNIALAMCMDAG